jgi:hypothetical protein
MRTRCTEPWHRWGLNNPEAACRLARETEDRTREAEFYIVLGDAWKSTGKQREPCNL